MSFRARTLQQREPEALQIRGLRLRLRKALASDRVLALDIGLELALLHAPLVPAAHLNRGKVAGTNQRVGLHLGDAQQLLNVGEGEEALGHAPILARLRVHPGLSTSVAILRVSRHDWRKHKGGGGCPQPRMWFRGAFEDRRGRIRGSWWAWC